MCVFVRVCACIPSAWQGMCRCMGFGNENNSKYGFGYVSICPVDSLDMFVDVYGWYV